MESATRVARVKLLGHAIDRLRLPRILRGILAGVLLIRVPRPLSDGSPGEVFDPL